MMCSTISHAACPADCIAGFINVISRARLFDAVIPGNFNNFLFQLLPKIAVYGPSGANQNFQYCGHNFASLPNGLGFGGQVNYWSLFIDGLFESGMSHKGATFTNPMSLSADTNFQVKQHNSVCMLVLVESSMLSVTCCC